MKKNEELFNIIDNLPDDLIEMANPENKVRSRTKSYIIAISAFAAALAICLGVNQFTKLNTGNSKPEANNSAVSETTASESFSEPSESASEITASGHTDTVHSTVSCIDEQSDSITEIKETVLAESGSAATVITPSETYTSSFSGNTSSETTLTSAASEKITDKTTSPAFTGKTTKESSVPAVSSTTAGHTSATGKTTKETTIPSSIITNVIPTSAETHTITDASSSQTAANTDSSASVTNTEESTAPYFTGAVTGNTQTTQHSASVTSVPVSANEEQKRGIFTDENGNVFISAGNPSKKYIKRRVGTENITFRDSNTGEISEYKADVYEYKNVDISFAGVYKIEGNYISFINTYYKLPEDEQKNIYDYFINAADINGSNPVSINGSFTDDDVFNYILPLLFEESQKSELLKSVPESEPLCYITLALQYSPEYIFTVKIYDGSIISFSLGYTEYTFRISNAEKAADYILSLK